MRKLLRTAVFRRQGQILCNTLHCCADHESEDIVRIAGAVGCPQGHALAGRFVIKPEQLFPLTHRPGDSAGNGEIAKSCIGADCCIRKQRKFADALKVLPMEQRRGSSAAEALQYFAKIAAWEKKLEGVTPEKRYKKRQEKEKPILDALYAWAEARKNVAPKSALGKALYYLREQRPYLERYLLEL